MMHRRAFRGSRVILLGAMVVALLALSPAGAAAQDSNAARVVRVAGRVEILPADQQQAWVPARVGALLTVGAEIRAFEGGWAEIRLADATSVVLAENSRLVVTRLEIDSQTNRRASVFHLVVGKVRAIIGRAAFTLIRFRESDFAITTPTAVAAARGTDLTVMHVTFSTMVGHEGSFLCLDLGTGIMAPITAFVETQSCRQLRTVSSAHEQLVRSTTFPDSKQIHQSLSDLPSTVTDPKLGQIGGPLASLSQPGAEFVGQTSSRGPTLEPNLSETTTRQLR
jgi:hypothetical protein